MRIDWKKINPEKYFLPLLSGVFLSVSHPPFPPLTILFAFVPLWYLWLKKDFSFKSFFFTGWITQFVLSFLGTHWVAYTLHEYGQLPWSIAFVFFLIYCCIAWLYIPLVGVGYFFIDQICKKYHCSLSIPQRVFILALLTGILEESLPVVFPLVSSYGLIAYQIPIYQLADIFGFFTLNTFFILLNALLFLIGWQWNRGRKEVHRTNRKGRWYLFRLFSALKFWKRKDKQGSSNVHYRQGSVMAIHPQLPCLSLVCLYLCILIGLCWGGSWYGKKWKRKEISLLKVGVVQSNIGNAERIYAVKGSSFKDYILEKQLALSEKVLSRFPYIDLMVWSETSLPLSFRIRENKILKTNLLQKKFFSRIKSYSKPLITGTYIIDEKNKAYNALLLLDKESNLLAFYRKSNLLLFGETFWGLENLLPLEKWIPGLGGGFAKGPGPKVSSLNHWKIGWHICYDSAFPSFSRELAQKGSQVIINLTNDSWFGKTSEPYQHMYMALARGIEIRRSVLRATNSGFSVAMSFTGELFPPSPLWEEWYGAYDIPILSKEEQTFFTRFGFIWPYIKLLILFLIIGFSFLSNLGFRRKT